MKNNSSNIDANFVHDTNRLWVVRVGGVELQLVANRNTDVDPDSMLTHKPSLSFLHGPCTVSTPRRTTQTCNCSSSSPSTLTHWSSIFVYNSGSSTSTNRAACTNWCKLVTSAPVTKFSKHIIVLTHFLDDLIHSSNCLPDRHSITAMPLPHDCLRWTPQKHRRPNFQKHACQMSKPLLIVVNPSFLGSFLFYQHLPCIAPMSRRTVLMTNHLHRI